MANSGTAFIRWSPTGWICRADVARDGETVDDAWRRLRAHLNRSRSFWLGVIVTDSPWVAVDLREQARINRRLAQEPFESIVPRTPSELAGLLTRVEAAPPPSGCIWIEAVEQPKLSVNDLSWIEGWARLARALNHRRDALRRKLGGLVLVLPTAVKSIVMREASDLWSVRVYLAEPTSYSEDPARRLEPAGSVFVSYRRSDTDRAADSIGAALRRRLGPNRVFLDDASTTFGHPYASVLEKSLRDAATVLVLIGPGWDVPPLGDRLAAPDDWVRREILLARRAVKRVIPVLVDRSTVPRPSSLPDDLRFLTELQYTVVRSGDPDDIADLVNALTSTAPPPQFPRTSGVERTRAAIEGLLRTQLPQPNQWSGNKDRLTDLALAVLQPSDRLVFLAPCRVDDGPPGSATILITESEFIVVNVGEDFLIRGVTRLPQSTVRRVEVVQTLPLFADVVIHTGTAEPTRLQGLFRRQARDLADHLRQPAS